VDRAHYHAGAARGLIILTVSALTSFGCVKPLSGAAENDQEVPRAAQLGAYRLGMDLRQTFDSLSPTAHRARIELLNENVDAWAARWQLIAHAQATIDIDYFIFSQDLFGLALLGHLVEKAAAGVRVRLQIDAQGMAMSTQPYADCLPFVAGVENLQVRLHRSLSRRFVEAIVYLEPTLATASDHDKIIVVDGRSSVVGGRNIEEKYFAHPEDLPEAFRDVDIVLDSAGAAKTLTEVFETTFEGDHVTAVGGARMPECSAALRLAYESMDAWLRGRPVDDGGASTLDGSEIHWASALQRHPHSKGSLARPRAVEQIEAETRILDSLPRPGSPADAVTRSLARLFDTASQQILIETPYVVLTERAASMLAAAGKRGTELTLLTNSPLSTDNGLSQLYFREQWPRLLAAVPKLRLFGAGTKRNVHSKFVVFDEQATLIGSYNFDPFSMLVSGEVMVAVWSQEFARRLSQTTRATIAQGPPAAYEYTIKRGADGNPVRTADGVPVIEFGPADHTEVAEGPLYGFRWALLRAVPWLTGLPPFF
jgi:phosphatidylserine/phosphatidylglycerophosphate/cardiolipin synthase-like enzyme